MAPRKGMGARNITTYGHPDKEWVNNPPVGLVTPETDRDTGGKSYAHDPHLDPHLCWSGKAGHTSFEVPTVSLHGRAAVRIVNNRGVEDLKVVELVQ